MAHYLQETFVVMWKLTHIIMGVNMFSHLGTVKKLIVHGIKMHDILRFPLADFEKAWVKLLYWFISANHLNKQPSLTCTAESNS